MFKFVKDIGAQKVFFFQENTNLSRAIMTNDNGLSIYNTTVCAGVKGKALEIGSLLPLLQFLKRRGKMYLRDEGIQKKLLEKVNVYCLT